MGGGGEAVDMLWFMGSMGESVSERNSQSLGSLSITSTSRDRGSWHNPPMTQDDPASPARRTYPRGFRARRGLNWGILGLTYASYYVCRYNFRFATPGLLEEYGFS